MPSPQAQGKSPPLWDGHAILPPIWGPSDAFEDRHRCHLDHLLLLLFRGRRFPSVGLGEWSGVVVGVVPFVPAPAISTGWKGGARVEAMAYTGEWRTRCGGRVDIAKGSSPSTAANRRDKRGAHKGGETGVERDDSKWCTYTFGGAHE